MDSVITNRAPAKVSSGVRETLTGGGQFYIVSALLLLALFVSSVAFISHRNISTIAAALDASLVSSSKQMAVVLRTNLREEIAALTSGRPDSAGSGLENNRLPRLMDVMFADTSLLKVKIFNGDGKVVYSTKEADIGRHSGELAEFKAASAGGYASTTKVRSSRDFNVEPELPPSVMHVTSTYVAIADSPDDGLSGYVLETYSDVTADIVLAERSTRLSVITSLFIAAALLALVLVLSLYRYNKKHALRQRDEAHAEILEQRATTDHLTKVGNRNAFEQALSDYFSMSAPEKSVCLISIDVDDFKRINDIYGHKVGDEALVSAAVIILRCQEGMGSLFRTGGDEFAVFGTIEPEDAEAIAKRIASAFSESLQIGNLSVKQSVTMGIAHAQQAIGETGGQERLLLEADLALFYAKANNRGSYALYTQGMSEGRVVSTQLTHELSVALLERQFVLHYQPRVDIVSGRIDSVEALVRWQHPERGLLYPDQFIPSLEKSGLIAGLSVLVLDQCCEFLQKNRKELGDELRVSINISPAELNDSTLHRKFERLLAARAIPASRFEIEVTESILLSDRRQFVEAINRFRNMGFSLSVDDFGMGYSNLRQLCEIGPESLKIDRSLVERVAEDEQMQVIVKYVAHLGSSMGATVVVEGVETPEQLACIRELGCQFVQGFLFDKALPGEQLVPKFHGGYAC